MTITTTLFPSQPPMAMPSGKRFWLADRGRDSGSALASCGCRTCAYFPYLTRVPAPCAAHGEHYMYYAMGLPIHHHVGGGRGLSELAR